MKYDKKKAAAFDPSAAVPTSRSYQLELLEESLRRNIIIALDTGAGKTHIAVLRIKTEVLERETRKVIVLPDKILMDDAADADHYEYFAVIVVRGAHSRPRGAAERSHRDPYTRVCRIGVRRIRSPPMEGPLTVAGNRRLSPCYGYHPTSSSGCPAARIC